MGSYQSGSYRQMNGDDFVFNVVFDLTERRHLTYWRWTPSILCTTRTDAVSLTSAGDCNTKKDIVWSRPNLKLNPKISPPPPPILPNGAKFLESKMV